MQRPIRPARIAWRIDAIPSPTRAGAWATPNVAKLEVSAQNAKEG